MVLWGHTVSQLREGGQAEWMLCLSFLNLAGAPGGTAVGTSAGEGPGRAEGPQGADWFWFRPRCVTQVQLMDTHQKVCLRQEHFAERVALCNTPSCRPCRGCSGRPSGCQASPLTPLIPANPSFVP